MNEYNLNRFKEAQNPIFQTVVKELTQGKKCTHWMWFIFPQIEGLAKSSQAQFYSLKNSKEVLAYWSDDLLRNRYLQCLQALEKQSHLRPEIIFGFPDYLKFHSSLTLFAHLRKNAQVSACLNNFFSGEADRRTLEILEHIQ